MLLVIFCLYVSNFLVLYLAILGNIRKMMGIVKARKWVRLNRITSSVMLYRVQAIADLQLEIVKTKNLLQNR